MVASIILEASRSTGEVRLAVGLNLAVPNWLWGFWT